MAINFAPIQGALGQLQQANALKVQRDQQEKERKRQGRIALGQGVGALVGGGLGFALAGPAGAAASLKLAGTGAGLGSTIGGITQGAAPNIPQVLQLAGAGAGALEGIQQQAAEKGILGALGSFPQPQPTTPLVGQGLGALRPPDQVTPTAPGGFLTGTQFESALQPVKDFFGPGTPTPTPIPPQGATPLTTRQRILQAAQKTAQPLATAQAGLSLLPQAPADGKLFNVVDNQGNVTGTGLSGQEASQSAQGTPGSQVVAIGTQPITAPSNAEFANLNPQQRESEIKNLRSQFLKQSESFLSVRDSFVRVQESAKDPSAAGDLSMIFAYMKMLDPGSVVREGEQATAAKARGVPDGIRSLYNRVLSGQKLGVDQRADFVNRAERLFGPLQQIQAKNTSEFTRLSQAAGVKPERVIVDLSLGGQEQGSQANPFVPKTQSDLDKLQPGQVFKHPVTGVLMRR